MALDFSVKDIIHKITVKFVKGFLPGAKKPYNLRAVFQPELDVHGIASKAEVYNITTPPKVIEEGLLAGMELMYYLCADGYKVKTPLFNMRIRVGGEYDGSETFLPHGIYPEVRLQASAPFRNYLKERVKVEFDGIDQANGFIAQALDVASGTIDEVLTLGNLLDIHGYGLKIESDEAHSAEVGLFFDDGIHQPIKAEIVAVNEPRRLKVIIPAILGSGQPYTLKLLTMSSAKTSAHLLKDVREIRSEFTVTAQ